MAMPPLEMPNLDKLWIGGRWQAPVQPRFLDIISPDTEEVVARVAEAREADMDLVVIAARRAFDVGPWPRVAPVERARLLGRMGEILKAREPELAAAWTLQIGCLPSIAQPLTSVGTQHFLRTPQIAAALNWEQEVTSPMAKVAIIVREPVGVVAAIAPWNAPFMLMCAKVAPALLAGCTVIMKPAPETPLEAYILAQCAVEAGLPAGVLNLVTSNRDAADHLVRNPGIDKVAFTGSTIAGQRIAAVCGERIARCTLELGGKSAAIVLDDYPIQSAAETLARTITVLSGQVCATLSRAIVPRRKHDELADGIAKILRTIRIGRSTDPETEMGPLAMKRQLHRVEEYIAKGKASAATLVTGGKRPEHLKQGFFFEPTLFANVDNRSPIAQEEIFGPVLSLIPADDTEDMVRIANESIYGLNGSVLTHDAAAAYRIGRQIRAGNIGQNGLKADFDLPFGGFKMSGIGREGGVEGLMNYLETKTMLLDGAARNTEY